MLKYFIVLVSFCYHINAQSLTLRNEYTPLPKGSIDDFAVVKNPDNNKNFIFTIEKTEGLLQLVAYSGNFSRLGSHPVSANAFVKGAFIRNGFLYYVDNSIMQLSLNDFSTRPINADRKGIRKIALASLQNKEVILSQNKASVFICELPSLKEILNIKIQNSENNFGVSLIYQGDIYYSSESDLLAKFSISENRIAWQIKFPEKPIKFIGIRVTSMPNWITSIVPLKLDGKDCICAFLAAGDNFCINTKNGKVVDSDKEYDTFTDLKQNNVKLFSSAALLAVGQEKLPLFYLGSIDKNVYALSGRERDDVWVTPVGNEVSMPLSFCDINSDLYPEVFGVTDYDNNLFVLDGKSGKKLINYSIKTGSNFNQTRVYLADLSGNGVLNIVVKSNMRIVKILEFGPEVKVPLNFLYNADN